MDELHAFWSFLARQYNLPQASEIALKLDDEAKETLHDELSDSSNYGMAKSMFMLGRESGFDMTTEEGLNEFMSAYNASIAANSAQGGITRQASPRNPKSKSTLTAEQRKAREKLRKKQERASKRKGESKKH